MRGVDWVVFGALDVLVAQSTRLRYRPSSCADLVPTLSWAMRLYTRTGDGGTSGLLGGGRRSKTDVIFCALGDVDELCCSIGVAAAHLRVRLERDEALGAESGAASPPSVRAEASSVADDLMEIQSRLFDLGSVIASANTPDMLPSSPFDPALVGGRDAASPSRIAVSLERRIDALSASLPRLVDFILPSGSLAGAQLHLARAVARRAERSVAAVAEAQRALDQRRESSAERALTAAFGSIEVDARESGGGSAADGSASSAPSSSSSLSRPGSAPGSGTRASCRLACALVYLNRLSDYLFAAARIVNAAAGTTETTWKQLRSDDRVDA